MLKHDSWPIDRLIEYDNNPRKNDHAVDRIAAAIKAFGFRIPVVARSDGTVVDGHLRLKAARMLGMTEIPIVLADDLSDAEIKAFRISVNKMAELAEWDEDMLRSELQDLQDINFDLDVIGFSEDELTEWLFEQTEAQAEEDEVLSVSSNPISRAGDVWLMGKHRIICGSSTDADTVNKLLNGAKPHLMVTDPPYGVEYDATWRNDAKLNAPGAAVGKVLNDNIADWREAWALFPGDVAYVWHASTFSAVVSASLAACKFESRALIIWAKSQLVIGRGHYHHQHEPCWYAVRGGASGRWEGGRKRTTLWRNIRDILRPDEEVYCRKVDAETIHAISGDESTVWEIPKPSKSETGHSTQKPVECMRRPIQNNSRRGDAIYEPFSGSGTTLIASEQTGRICYAVELNPPYVDMAVQRWQNFTGKQAVLEATGQTFDELHEAQA